MKLGVTSDIHLTHVSLSDPYRIRRVAKELTMGLDALLICGDLSSGNYLKFHLDNLHEGALCPIYFILGNHDRWGWPHDSADQLSQKYSGYIAHKVKILNDDTCLVGSNGWFDARIGNLKNLYTTNDLTQIPELLQALYVQGILLDTLRSWADQDAFELRDLLSNSTLYDTVKRVIVATHYPPWYNEKDDPIYYPWSVSTIMGEVLEGVAETWPNVQFEIIAGHTHNKWHHQVKDNLSLTIGTSEYGQPAVQQIIYLA